MTPADILLAAVILAFVAWIGWELYRAPVEPFDRSMADQDEAAAQECIEASRPAELRPHVKAITEVRQ